MAAPIRDALQFPDSESQKIHGYIPLPTSQTVHFENVGKAFVTLTFATSLDSQLAIAPGVQTALSGPQSKAMTHFLRSRHDAILVGCGTAVADNPSLNCRIEGVGGYGGDGLVGQPRPVIVDPNNRWQFSAESKVMKLAKEGKGKAPFIVTRVEPSASSQTLLESIGGKFLITDFTLKGGRLDWHKTLEMLSEQGIKSIMIEGGGFVINDLLNTVYGNTIIDSVIVTIAPTWLGKGGVQVCPDRDNSSVPFPRMKDVKWIPLGEDVVLCGRLNYPLTMVG